VRTATLALHWQFFASLVASLSDKGSSDAFCSKSLQLYSVLSVLRINRRVAVFLVGSEVCAIIG
jgi:hypothetical protein